jgi:hypothetical protein
VTLPLIRAVVVDDHPSVLDDDVHVPAAAHGLDGVVDEVAEHGKQVVVPRGGRHVRGVEHGQV